MNRLRYEKRCLTCRRSYMDEWQFAGCHCPDCFKLLFALERVNAGMCDDPGDPAQCADAWKRIERLAAEKGADALRAVDA